MPDIPKISYEEMRSMQCTRLTKREQLAWVRAAIYHFFAHYELFDMIDGELQPIDEPQVLPNGQPPTVEELKLYHTHNWILEEIGIRHLIAFMRPRIFSAGEEESSIAQYKKMCNAKELSEEQWEHFEIAYKASHLFRSRIFFNCLFRGDIAGQPNIGRFLRRHLSNAGPDTISSTLRMRKVLFVEGKLTPDNDNPNKIRDLFLELFEPEIKAICSHPSYMEMASDLIHEGYSIEKVKEALEKLPIAPPEEEWEILPEQREIQGIQFRIVRKDDPENLRVGQINNSCMVIGSTAEECLFDAITNPMSSLMVLSAGGHSIGHSWLRLGKSGRLYLDNIELVATYHRDERLASAVREWARISQWKQVAIGKQYTYLPIVGDEEVSLSQELLIEEFGEVAAEIYTDLDEEGAWVIENSKAGLTKE